MALHVSENAEQYTGFVVSIVFAPICIIATSLRFLATKRYHRPYGGDDWLALIGCIIFLSYIAYALWLFSTINGRPVLVFAKEDPHMAVEVLKAGDIMNGVYGIQQSFVKFSLLVLYYRLFWINDKFRIAVWAVGIAQGAWGLAVLLVHIFACNPIAKVWNPKIPGHCIDVNLFFNIYEPLNALLDFIVAGLAIWMLPALQMRRRTLVHLGFLFALGSFSGIISIIKVVQAQYAAQRNFQSVIWNIVQMATSIICCCAPIYQSILPKFGVYDKLYSWVSTVLSSRRSHGDSAGRHGPAANTSTGDNNRSKSGGLSQRSQWFNNYNGSSERALAWAEAGLKQNKGGSLGSKDTVNIPSGRVRVDRTVDVA